MNVVGPNIFCVVIVAFAQGSFVILQTWPARFHLTLESILYVGLKLGHSNSFKVVLKTWLTILRKNKWSNDGMH